MLAAHDLFKSACIYIKENLNDAGFVTEDFLGKTGQIIVAKRCLRQCSSPVFLY